MKGSLLPMAIGLSLAVFSAAVAQDDVAELGIDSSDFIVQGKIQAPEVEIEINQANLDKEFDIQLNESFLDKIIDALDDPVF